MQVIHDVLKCKL